MLAVDVGLDLDLDAAAAAQYDNEPERWLDVRWEIEEDNPERFPARIKVLAANAPGTLATIAEVIAANDGNIQNLTMNVPVEDFTEMEIDIEVRDLSHLERIIGQLAKKRVTTRVDRIIG